MNATEAKHRTEAITRLFTLCNMPFDAAKLTVWLDELSDLPLTDLQRGCALAVRRKREFPPMASEVRDLATAGAHIAPGDAWLEVRRQIGAVGRKTTIPRYSMGEFIPWSPPTFSHPSIAAAVDTVGWDRLCTGNAEHVEREFQRAFAMATGQRDLIPAVELAAIGDGA